MPGELATRRRARRDSILGRRHCSRCSRWRLACIDFSVSSWEDCHKTKPKQLHSKCKLCVRAHTRELEDRRRDPHRGVKAVFTRMTLRDRQEYPLEGGVPLTRYSAADEDYDPTPVPKGCPSCFLSRTDSGGHSEVCLACPDRAGAIARRRGRWS
jgi:hypothetical protein